MAEIPNPRQLVADLRWVIKGKVADALAWAKDRALRYLNQGD